MKTSQTVSKNKLSWNRKYEVSHYVFGLMPEPFLVQQESIIQARKSVLSIGGGEGKNEVWMAKLGAEVYNVDISGIGLHKARNLAEANHVHINTLEADLLTWTWPVHRYDVVTWFFVHFAPEEFTGLTTHMIEALKPEGWLLGSLFVDHTGADREGEKIITRYDEEIFRKLSQYGDFHLLRYGSKRRGQRPPEKTIEFLFKKNTR